MTITAIVLGHSDAEQIKGMLEQMHEQTKTPDEIIVCVCCMSVDWIDADKVLLDKHVDDTGQRLCDYGLRLASKDYVMFASSDDQYDVKFIERLSQETADIIHCDFYSHLLGREIQSQASLGSITRGSFIVRREIAKEIGYNHRDYNGDGHFVHDLKNAGATDIRVPEVLYRHN